MVVDHDARKAGDARARSDRQPPQVALVRRWRRVRAPRPEGPSKLGRRARRPGPPSSDARCPRRRASEARARVLPRLRHISRVFNRGRGCANWAGASGTNEEDSSSSPLIRLTRPRGSMRPTSMHVGLHDPRRGVQHRWVRNRSKSPPNPSRRPRALRSDNKAQVQGQEAVPVPGVGPYGG